MTVPIECRALLYCRMHCDAGPGTPLTLNTAVHAHRVAVRGFVYGRTRTWGLRGSPYT